MKSYWLPVASAALRSSTPDLQAVKAVLAGGEVVLCGNCILPVQVKGVAGISMHRPDIASSYPVAWRLLRVKFKPHS